MNMFRQQLAIDKASNIGAGEEVEITKRRRSGAPMTPAQALAISLATGLDDPNVVDKGAYVAEQTRDYLEHVAKLAKGTVVPFRKGDAVHQETIVAIAKNVIERGADPVFAKHEYIAAVNKRALEIKKPSGESFQQAFSRAISTPGDIGALLYRASKFAQGPETGPNLDVPNGSSTKPDGTPWPATGPNSSTGATKIPAWEGPASAKMRALADDHAKANPRKTEAGAYAAVYTDPKNQELRQAVISEHHNAILASSQNLDGAKTGVVG